MPSTTTKSLRVVPISAVIVEFRGEEFLDGLFKTLQQQSVQPKEIIVVNNSRSAITGDITRKYFPSARVFTPEKNLDFCMGYNWGLNKSTQEYVLILNQDTFLSADALEIMYGEIKKNACLGAVGPKILRPVKDGDTPVVDSMGIKSTRGRRFYNVGEGELDYGQYDQYADVFGLSGTAILLRRVAMVDLIKYSGSDNKGLFDQQFVAYKEDVDLAYRLHHRSWQVKVVPSAIIYHHRHAQDQVVQLGWRGHRSLKSWRLRAYSYRNHLWVLLKNEPWQNLVLASPFIFWYELQKIIFMLIWERSTFRVWSSLLQGIHQILKKRKNILTNSQISPRTLRQLIS